MEERWTYERLGDVMDKIPLPSPWTEAERQKYRAAADAILKEAGWTVDEYEDHLEELLASRGFFESARECPGFLSPNRESGDCGI